MKTLTVVTTTYNRAYCLPQVYESLLRQTSDDFLWLIMDDGSSDNTKELADAWIAEGKVEIEYYYQKNKGMHIARNAAYEKVHTELNVMIDSDDWMTDNAVELIVNAWKKNGSEKFYGMISHNVDTNGKMIGNPFPKNVEHDTLTNLFEKRGVSGDKKLILRSDLSKLYPYPEFEGEKFYPASYKFKYLDLDYELYILDEFTCVVDCNDNSMTHDKYAQYRTCAKGYAHYRNAIIKITKSPKKIIREMIHYIAESKYASDKHYIKNSSKKGYAILCLVPGLGYYYYLQRTKRKY